MKCESVREKLTAYLDGELEGDRGSAVRGHLRGCAACRQVASDEAVLRDGLRALPPLDPPSTLWAGVQARLAAAEVEDSERPAWRRALARWMPRAPQIGLASAAFAAAATLIVVRMHHGDGPAPTNAPVALQPKFAPDHGTAQASTALKPQAGDVTAEIAAEPSQITASYAATADELLADANAARAQWPDDRKHQFDTQLAALQKKVAGATDERPRREAYRKLIRFLQHAAVEDDVAFASTGGVPQ